MCCSVDLFPPGPHDPHGMHGEIWQLLDDEPYDAPLDEPLTLASYVAEVQPEAYLEHTAVGSVLPRMPLFLHPERYTNVPLEANLRSGDPRHAGVLASCPGRPLILE